MQRRSKDFDKIIKDKLNGLSVGSNPSDWIMMERLLEMEGLTKPSEDVDEVRFDEIAHDKLGNITNAALIPDWDRMSSLLDAINEEPSMEPSEFDQAIDNRIKHSGPPLSMDVWDRMEPILDSDRASVVKDYDDVAKDKLTQVSEVDPAWSSMNSKINRELFLPESIVKYKVIEVALILLFAFSLAQFPLDQINNSPSADRITPLAPTKVEKSIAEDDIEPIVTTTQVDARVAKTLNSSAIVPASTEQVTNSNVEDFAPQNYDKEKAALALLAVPSSIDWDLPPTIGEVLNKLSEKPRFSISRMAIASALFKIEAAEQQPELIDLSTQTVAKAKKNIFGNPVMGKSVESIQSETEPTAAFLSEINSIDIDNIEFPRRRPAVEERALATEKESIGLVLGLFSGSDYNEIITPFDQIYLDEGSNQWSLGYAGGISLGMQFKNWELETGAIYASNQYQPRQQYEIYSGSISSGYIASTLKDIELDIVRIPLNFRFNVNLWDNWKVYALSGATMNMVLQSEFITDDIFIGTKTFATPSAPAFQNTALSLKDFGEGILEGGRFKDNSFLTANLGFGVERTLNTKWSIFAQPTYQRQIFSNGIGPNQDRFNSISLFLGTRISLK